MGRVLWARRERLGLTLEAAAGAAGVSRWGWRRWEKGIHSIPGDQLPDIAKVLKCSIADLYGSGVREPDGKVVALAEAA